MPDLQLLTLTCVPHVYPLATRARTSVQSDIAGWREAIPALRPDPNANLICCVDAGANANFHSDGVTWVQECVYNNAGDPEKIADLFSSGELYEKGREVGMSYHIQKLGECAGLTAKRKVFCAPLQPCALGRAVEPYSVRARAVEPCSVRARAHVPLCVCVCVCVHMTADPPCVCVRQPAVLLSRPNSGDLPVQLSFGQGLARVQHDAGQARRGVYRGLQGPPVLRRRQRARRCRCRLRRRVEQGAVVQRDARGTRRGHLRPHRVPRVQPVHTGKDQPLSTGQVRLDRAARLALGRALPRHFAQTCFLFHSRRQCNKPPCSIARDPL